MLSNQIENAGRKVSTDSITMSFGEIANYYRDKDLNINPEFQRAFRWTVDKKSHLIESLLLSIPLPSVFVFEKEDKSWELVDGLQRLSTVFEFMGILRDANGQGLVEPSSMTKTKYLPDLEGVVWDASSFAPDEGFHELPSEYKRKIRTSRLQVEILRHPSDVETKFDLFQRLNRGGETANAQEVRNCLCVMANEKGFRKIKKLANEKQVLKILKLTPGAIEQQRHLEWLMRIIAHGLYDFHRNQDVEAFVDDSLRDVLSSGDIDDALRRAKEVFRLLDEAHGEDALLPGLGSGGKGNRVSLRQIEAIAVGVFRNVDLILDLKQPVDFVKGKAEDFWEQEEVDRMSAAGLNPGQRIPRTVPFGADWFKP